MGQEALVQHAPGAPPGVVLRRNTVVTEDKPAEVGLLLKLSYANRSPL